MIKNISFSSDLVKQPLHNIQTFIRSHKKETIILTAILSIALIIIGLYKYFTQPTTLKNRGIPAPPTTIASPDTQENTTQTITLNVTPPSIQQWIDAHKDCVEAWKAKANKMDRLCFDGYLSKTMEIKSGSVADIIKATDKFRFYQKETLQFFRSILHLAVQTGTIKHATPTSLTVRDFSTLLVLSPDLLAALAESQCNIPPLARRYDNDDPQIEEVD